MTWKVKNAEFLISAANIAQLPVDGLPEFALIGRSNAGKSTLLNRICGRRALAKVSSRPGKTQQINLYLVTLTNGEEDRQIYITDLPGYGYAKVSKVLRQNLAKLVVNYFEKREQLKLVFLLSDIKRNADETDVDLRNFVYNTEKSVQVVLTKADKVNQKEKAASVKNNSTKFGLEPGDLIFSSMDKDPISIFGRMMLSLESEKDWDATTRSKFVAYKDQPKDLPEPSSGE